MKSVISVQLSVSQPEQSRLRDEQPLNVFFIDVTFDVSIVEDNFSIDKEEQP